ncbi:MAG TPA: hypothetical protein VF303_03025, partial [Candidatus Nanoarchaeia archaeon]
MAANRGQMLIELVLAVAIAVILLTVLTTGIIAAREGFVRSERHLEANIMLQKEVEALRSARETGWNSFSSPSTYHTQQSGSSWTVTTGTITEGDYTRGFTVANVCRLDPDSPPIDCSDSRSFVDPSTKEIAATVSWSFLGTQSVSSTFYLTRYFGNQAWTQTTKAQFDQGIHQGTTATNISGGEVQIDFTPPPSSCLDGYWQDPMICDTYDTPGGDGRGVFVEGNYAYMVSGGMGADFFIFDISSPENISLVGSLDLGAVGYSISVAGNYAYVTTDHTSRELTVVNISNKANPQLAGSHFNTTSAGQGIAIYSNTAYLVTNNNTSGTGYEFYALNITNPLSPTQIGGRNLGAAARNIFVSGNYAYIASTSNTQELQVVNLSNFSAPLGTFNASGTSNGLSIYVVNTTAYLAAGATLYLLDASNPSSIPSTPIGTYNAGATIYSVFVSGNLAFLGTSNTSSEFQVVDLSNPSTPALFGSEDLNGATMGLFIVGDFAYLANADDNAEFQIINGGDPPVGGGTGCAGNWQAPEVCKTDNASVGDGRGVFVSGDYAYMVSGGTGADFFIYDISDPENFLLVSSLDLGTTGFNVFVLGNYAYVATADDAREMIVIDISNKSSPNIIGNYNAPGTADGYGVFAKGNVAYLTTGGAGDDLHILDVNDPANPTLLGSMNLGGNGYDIVVSGGFAYIASSNDNRELDVINISDPSNPTRAGTYNASGGANGLGVYVLGATAYLTTQNSGDEFYILNIADLNNILLVGSLNLGANGNDVFVDRDLAFVATSNGSSEFQVIDISNPASPSLYGSTNLNGNALGVFVFGDYAVIGNADNNAEFQVIKGGALYNGTFVSAVFDAGSLVGFNFLTWTATLPAQTGVRFQLAT